MDASVEVVVMTKTQLPTVGLGSTVEQHVDAQLPQVRSTESHRKQHVSPFWRHFLQMTAAMAVGMIVTGAIFVAVVGLKTWDEVTRQYPTQSLLAMAAGMTVPMLAWMTYRGMGWRNSYEMAAAMILPVIPFLCLVWFDVTKSAQCGAYCLVTVVAMLVLMRHRRDEYSSRGVEAGPRQP